MKIWIYRPDKRFHPAVNLEYVYDLRGIPYHKVVATEDELRHREKSQAIFKKDYQIEVRY